MPIDADFFIVAVPLLLMTGAVAGLLAGMLGVGGGIVIVPVLFWLIPVFGIGPAVAMHSAVATSLASIVFTSISSARAHYRKGVVDLVLLRRWLPWIIIGSAAGGFLATLLNGAVLGWIFGGVAFAVALLMVRARAVSISESLPNGHAPSALLAASIGVFSALMGIGGGTLTVPVLSLFSMPIHKSVGTASSFGVAIALSAVGFFVWGGWTAEGLPPGSVGYVNLPAALLISCVSIVTAPLGARIAHALPKLTLRRVFAAFLFVTGARLVF